MNALKSKKAVTLYVLSGVSLLLIILSKIPFLAEFMYARGVSRAINFTFSNIFGFLPFSAYEFLAILLIAAGCTLLVFLILFLCKKHYKVIVKSCYVLGIIALSCLMFFTASYGGLYARFPLADHLDLDKSEITEQNLIDATVRHTRILTELSNKMQRAENGDIIPPYDFHALSEKINSELTRHSNSYLSTHNVTPKKVLMSEAMSYLRITGIYFPFTGEANINMTVSPFELPQIMAHELSHSRGIARENEANLMSYYLLINSDDDYLKYSGYMSTSLVLLSNLRRTNTEVYKTIYATLPLDIQSEVINDSIKYKKYDSFIGDISHFFNNLFLKSNGIENGTTSYGDTVKYLVNM